jgi:hypothetical protein
MKNEMKNPDKVVLEFAAYKHPNPIIVNISIMK